MAAVGDVMLSREVHNQMVKRDDFSWPFLETADILAKADLTVGNLEAPLLEICPPMTNRMIFCAEDESIEGMEMAGFDVWSLANNHILNQGQAGLQETERILGRAGMLGVAEGEVEIVEVEGVIVGWMGFDAVWKELDEAAMRVEVASASAETDVLVVMMHWGVEYVATPTAQQVRMGRGLVDAGADVVLGSHPHWTQPVEEYKDGLIFYSLGNFVFDQMWSEETRLGEIALLKLKVLDSELLTMEYETVPVRVYEYGQPRVIDSEISN
jgi:poly-gamma-glutamate synthesis protein (capsule biosynthesis protein)